MATAHLRLALLGTLSTSAYDFCKTETLVRDMALMLQAPRSEVMSTLDELYRQKMIRHPFDYTARELEWWRLVKRGYTRRERWRMAKAILCYYPITTTTGKFGEVF